MDKLNHWRYFLSLESEFSDALRYVEFTPKQQEVFSFEFARLLLLTCSELDVVFKVICSHVAPMAKAESIGQYFSCISTRYDIVSEVVRLDRFSERVEPYDQWDKDTPPAWWTAQNKVKHRRHEHFDQATLGNSMQALCGLFVANLILLNEYQLLRAVHEVPTLLGRDSEPGRLLLEASYTVAQR
jgi:hypothetical protein